MTSIWSSETFKGALAQTEEQAGDAAESSGMLAALKGLLTGAVEGVYNLLFGWIMGLIEAIARTIVVLLLAVLFLGLLVLPALVAYCSYLWGYFSLLVAIILGPLLIPWVLVPQLQFLAWGWFRTLLGAGVHMMVAGACFAVVAQILMIPIIRFKTLVTAANSQPVVEAISVHPLGLLAGTAGVALGAGLAAITESLPLILVAYLGAFKIGEITGMIMNGGSMPASGLGDRMRSMGSMRGTGRSLGMIAGRGAATAAAGAAAVRRPGAPGSPLLAAGRCCRRRRGAGSRDCDEAPGAAWATAVWFVDGACAFRRGFLLLWLAGPWAVPLFAQGTIAAPANADSFPQCIESQITTRVAALPPADQRNFFQDPDTLLNAVWICAGFYARPADRPDRLRDARGPDAHHGCLDRHRLHVLGRAGHGEAC